MKKQILFCICLIFLNLAVFSQSNIIVTNSEVPDQALQADIDAINSQNFVKSPEQFSGEKIMWCASANTLVTGYPAWLNYWAGWMVNINNISTNTITINCFEARFQGTSGYRIYTKTGTFVGFELNAAAWTLVGTAANVTGISTTTSTPIPIAVNVNINPGATQAFYLTRTDNTIANRHLYVAGAGTAGTTVYSSDANLQVTEGSYVDPFFAFLNAGTRRPSFQIYYSIYNPLPVELGNFKCSSDKTGTQLSWTTYSEKNNAYFSVERSQNGVDFEEIGQVEGAINSNQIMNYSFKDNLPKRGVNYYRLKQVDVNDDSKIHDMITCLYEPREIKINVYSVTGILLTSITSDDYKSGVDKLDLTPGAYLLELNDSETPTFIKYIRQ
ncbi:MAG TPA: hypothetical protein PLC65_14830 [Bacteroidia bacterium]|nr:hypothetical protein [Bacteroidia bacterium]